MKRFIRYPFIIIAVCMFSLLPCSYTLSASVNICDTASCDKPCTLKTEQEPCPWRITFKEEYEALKKDFNSGCSKTEIGIKKTFKLDHYDLTIKPFVEINYSFGDPDRLTAVQPGVDLCAKVNKYFSFGAKYKHGFSQIKGKKDSDKLELYVIPSYTYKNITIANKAKVYFVRPDHCRGIENELCVKYLMYKKDTLSVYPGIWFLIDYDLKETEMKKRDIGPGIVITYGDFSIQGKYIFRRHVQEKKNEQVINIECCYTF